MPVARKVLSGSSGTWIPCCWFECAKPGYELYKSVLHDHTNAIACNHPLAEHVNFIFCSERHKQLYLHSHVDLGKLPPGYKLSI